MGQSWGSSSSSSAVVAQMFCLDGLGDVGLPDDVRVLPRPRSPGHQLWRQVATNRIPRYAVIAICVLAAALMLPTLYNFFIGYYVGTGIAVIGLYIAFILPVILRYRMKDAFEPGAWSLGNHYKWIDPIAIVWVFFISIVFLMPPYSISVAVERRLHVGGRELRADPRRRRIAPLRRLVDPLRQELVQGPGAHGHRGGARAARGGAARPLRASDRSRRRRPNSSAMREAPRGASRVQASSAARNAGSAAVRSRRSKCSAA